MQRTNPLLTISARGPLTLPSRFWSLAGPAVAIDGPVDVMHGLLSRRRSGILCARSLCDVRIRVLVGVHVCDF